jgi:hypothetical protein
MASVLIAERKAIEQIFNRGKTDALKICRAPRADAFQVL